jgi:hypothetical protein
MAGFDAKWFDELRLVLESKLSLVHPQNIRPTVHELLGAKIVSSIFVKTTTELLRELAKTRYPFDKDFAAYERHITGFPKGRAFRKQWNIGFYAGEKRNEDCCRIGLGFKLNQHYGPEGIDDYADWTVKVSGRPTNFNGLFLRLGPYSEPEILFKNSKSLAARIHSDAPDLIDDWRFYGRLLSVNKPSDTTILKNPSRLAQYAAQTFEAIQTAGFY